jgi:hypothetical protein
MGVKKASKIFALLIAVVMIMTSAIGVFAAESPVKGATTTGTTSMGSGKQVTATWNKMNGASAYDVYANGIKVASNVTGTSAQFGVANGDWVITVVGKNGSSESKPATVGYVTTNAKKVKGVTAKRAGSKKIKVSWKKSKGATAYRITVYKNGAYWKTVEVSKKHTSKTFKKLKKNAKYKFVVEPVRNGFVGASGSSKSVKAK